MTEVTRTRGRIHIRAILHRDGKDIEVFSSGDTPEQQIEVNHGNSSR